MKKLLLLLLVVSCGSSYDPNIDTDNVFCISDDVLANNLSVMAKQFKEMEKASYYGYSVNEYQLAKRFDREKPREICKAFLKYLKDNNETLKETSWDYCHRNFPEKFNYLGMYDYTCERSNKK